MPRFHTISSPNPDYNPQGVRNPDYDPDANPPVLPEFLVKPDLEKFVVEDVPFTPDEEAQRDAEEAQHLADKPMRQWGRDMAEASRTMPDRAEEVWDAVGLTNASQTVKDAHAAKKAVRSRIPR